MNLKRAAVIAGASDGTHGELNAMKRLAFAIVGSAALALGGCNNNNQDAVQNARRYYNAVVRDFNTAISTIPSSFIAGPLNYKELEFFQAEAGDRELPKVAF